jgi:hypothetical protein
VTAVTAAYDLSISARRSSQAISLTCWLLTAALLTFWIAFALT